MLNMKALVRSFRLIICLAGLIATMGVVRAERVKACVACATCWSCANAGAGAWNCWFTGPQSCPCTVTSVQCPSEFC